MRHLLLVGLHGRGAGAALLLVAAALLPAASALAHEVRPAYLELQETVPATFEVTWKEPLLGDLKLPIEPVFPNGCADRSQRVPEMAAGALIERWTIACDPEVVANLEIRIEGLTRTLTDVLVRVVREDGTVMSGLLRPDAPAMVVSESSGVAVGAYLRLGIEHLLFGLDHVLFVIGLMFLVRHPWGLVKTITAFTVAHSVTLALSTLGIVRVAQQPVEVVIALSILFVAVELARGTSPTDSVAVRAPWVVAFCFGLLHGFGFAGVLADIGLPRDAAALALLLFNLGVEIGQLAIVALILAVLWGLRRANLTIPHWLRRAPIWGMGTLSSYWVVSRLVTFG